LHQLYDPTPMSPVAAGVAALLGNLTEADRWALGRMLLASTIATPTE